MASKEQDIEEAYGDAIDSTDVGEVRDVMENGAIASSIDETNTVENTTKPFDISEDRAISDEGVDKGTFINELTDEKLPEAFAVIESATTEVTGDSSGLDEHAKEEDTAADTVTTEIVPAEVARDSPTIDKQGKSDLIEEAVFTNPDGLGVSHSDMHELVGDIGLNEPGTDEPVDEKSGAD